MQMPGGPAFIRNQAVAMQIDADAAGPVRINISAYSALQGFTRSILTRQEPSGFAAALALAAGDAQVLEQLSPETTMALWASGLIILPPESVAAFVPSRFAISRDFYAANGYTLIPDCLAPFMVGAVAAHYRAGIDTGEARLSAGKVDRLSLYNDPAGRVVQQALVPAVAAMVGAPIKPSYTFASLYRGGAELPVHTDRPQCKYTLSLLIDHRPLPADGISPWAIQIHPGAAAPPVDCFQSLGGGILFRGQELPHGRRPLPADEACWTLLVHYVDADFTGSLD